MSSLQVNYFGRECQIKCGKFKSAKSASIEQAVAEAWDAAIIDYPNTVWANDDGMVRFEIEVSLGGHLLCRVTGRMFAGWTKQMANQDLDGSNSAASNGLQAKGWEVFTAWDPPFVNPMHAFCKMIADSIVVDDEYTDEDAHNVRRYIWRQLRECAIPACPEPSASDILRALVRLNRPIAAVIGGYEVRVGNYLEALHCASHLTAVQSPGVHDCARIVGELMAKAAASDGVWPKLFP